MKVKVEVKLKPCLKLKYCPYGVLVEDFELKEEPNEQSCGVFGHQCPAFQVAEKFVDK